jgi:hypothetical protein
MNRSKRTVLFYDEALVSHYESHGLVYMCMYESDFRTLSHTQTHTQRHTHTYARIHTHIHSHIHTHPY